MLILLCLSNANIALGQNISFTFDDPSDPEKPNQSDISPRILAALNIANLKSALYVCGMRVDTPSGVRLIQEWRASGHEISNHTYSHKSLSGSITAEDFIHDIKKNEDFLLSQGIHASRFRFPYLKEGNTAEKRDLVREWLKANGYKSGAVTVDASDWYYDQRFRSWREKQTTYSDAFKKAYLAHILDRANYYNNLAIQHLGRSPSLVLLLHANEINATYLTDIIAMFRNNGWNTINSEDAYADQIYMLEPDIVPAGESLIWQIAKERGDSTLRYPGEDEPYEKPILDELGL